MVERGESPRLMLFMPPRSGKSEIVSRNFPAWFLGRNPEMEIIACSYAASLANSFSRKVREILRDPAFKHIFPECELDKENQAVEQWMTSEGGAYVSAGVGGSIVGKGAHCVDGKLTVYTSRGIVPISKVKVGDYIYGYDHIANKPVYTRVEGVSAGRKDKLLDFGGIRVTPDHRVLDGRNYVQAENVNESSRLVSLLGLPEDSPQGVEGRATVAYRNWRERADNLLLEVMRENLAEAWRKSGVFVREHEGTGRCDMSEVLREISHERIEGRGDTARRLRALFEDFYKPLSEIRRARTSGQPNRNFCSQECYKAARNNTEPQVRAYCKNCSSPIYLRRRKFCSPECYQIARVEGQSSEPQSLSYRDGYQTAKAAVMVRDKGECQQCGSTTLVEVHHIDRNARNNSPLNLITLCKKCHASYHVLSEIQQIPLKIEFMQKAASKL